MSRADAAGVAATDAPDAGPWRRTIGAAALIWFAFTALRWIVLSATRLISGQQWGPAGVLSFPAAFDAGHFESIVIHGYTDDGDIAPIRQAFFPGYPALLRALSSLATGGVDIRGTHVAAFIVTTLASLTATVLVYRIADEQFGRPAGALAALLLMAWPSSTFLTVYYSESLYLALATAAWYCATRRWWWAAGLLCAAASLTRINGVFLVVALIVMLLVAVHRKQERFAWWKPLALSVGFAGAGVYLLYLWRLTGDPFAWSHAQTKGWGRETVRPWTALINTFRHYSLPTTDNYVRIQLTADLLAVVAGVAAMTWMAVRRYWAELTLTALTFAVLATSTVYWSITRNTLTIFPLFVLGGSILARRRGWISVVVLGLGAVWMLLMTVFVALSEWAG